MSDYSRFTPVAAPLLFRAPPGWRWRTRTGDWWNCWCALDGRCILRVAGRSIAVGPGSCLMLPPGSAVEADHDARIPAVNLAIHGRFLASNGQASEPPTPPPLHVVLPDPLRLARLAEDCIAAAEAGGTDAVAEYTALAQALLARIHRHVTNAGTATAGDRALVELLLDVHRHPGRSWTVAGCATRLGLSCSQLTRRFRTAYGTTPAAILARCRDEYAMRLVQESELPLAEIATLAGYVDASHLGRRLHARLGMPPGHLRSRRR